MARTCREIEGESGYVQEYDPFGNRYHVRLNNGRLYYFASRHLAVTQAPAEAVPLPPIKQHPLPATVTPKYKPPPLCLDLLKPDANQPELKLPPPAPKPVGSIVDAPPPLAPGPVPAGPSMKQGHPPKTRPPKILRVDPHTKRGLSPRVQRTIQKGSGYQKPSAPVPPPAGRATLHYTCDPTRPGPIAKPAALDPQALLLHLQGPGPRGRPNRLPPQQWSSSAPTGITKLGKRKKWMRKGGVGKSIFSLLP